MSKYGFFLASQKEKETQPKGVGFWKKEWGTTFESKEAYELAEMKAVNEKLSEDNEKLKANNEILKTAQAKVKCDNCDFEAKTDQGLKVHKAKCNERTRPN